MVFEYKHRFHCTIAIIYFAICDNDLMAGCFVVCEEADSDLMADCSAASEEAWPLLVDGLKVGSECK